MEGHSLNVEWGWMVVLGSFIMNVFNQSLVFIFGFLYGARFAELNFTQSQISIILSLSSVFTNLSGWFIGFAVQFFTLREVAVFGSLMISSGVVLSSFAETLGHFILTYGLMVGVGFGLMGSAAFLAVCSQFKARNKAVSLAMTGIGIGQMLMPQVVKRLMAVYGSKGTILIVGSLSLNGMIGAVLFRSVNRQEVKERYQSENDPLIPLKRTNSENVDNKIFVKVFRKAFDFGLLKDFRFFILNFGLSSGYTIIIDLSIALPALLRTSAQLDESQVAFCLTALATADVASRLTFHFIADRLHISCRKSFLFGLTAVGVTGLTLSGLESYHAIVVACVVLGYFKAVTVLNQYLSIAEYVSEFYENSDKLPQAMGINMMVKSLCVISIGQLFGWIRDRVAGYSITFHMQIVLIVLVVMLWSMERTFCRIR